MMGNENKSLRELCEQAANEYDPQKLHELVVEINRLLEERERQLLQQSIPGTRPASRMSDFCRTWKNKPVMK